MANELMSHVALGLTILAVGFFFFWMGWHMGYAKCQKEYRTRQMLKESEERVKDMVAAARKNAKDKMKGRTPWT